MPTAIGITHHTGPTPVSPTHSSQPGNGASQPSNGKNASPAPLTPQQYIYRTITEATVAGQSISTIDGHRDELKTIGAPTDVHLYPRIAEVDQPIPTAPVEKPQPTITIEPGEGGEQLMHALGKNPEEWYKIARELHKAYPNEFYLDGSDVRIAHTGPLPAQIIARIDGLTS